MKGSIVLEMTTDGFSAHSVLESIRLESLSAPSGGEVRVDLLDSDVLRLELTADDLSTLRAMLNSYLGLLIVAVRAASR